MVACNLLLVKLHSDYLIKLLFLLFELVSWDGISAPLPDYQIICNNKNIKKKCHEKGAAHSKHHN